MSLPWETTQDGCDNEYGRYNGVEELLPYSEGISARTYDFDSKGERPQMDYNK